MAHKKAAGSTKNLRDSKPKYLGIKLSDGQIAGPGEIILRQRGTKIIPGRNVRVGRDHTIYARKGGKVKFSTKRKKAYDGRSKKFTVANVV